MMDNKTGDELCILYERLKMALAELELEITHLRHKLKKATGWTDAELNKHVRR